MTVGHSSVILCSKIMAKKSQRKTLDANSLKKAAKWFFLDKVVIFSAVLGIILLILTLIVYAQDIKLIKYSGGINYKACKTPHSRLLFKVTTPALSVMLKYKGMSLTPALKILILYSLMFAAQIAVFGIVAKTARALSSDGIVTVSVCIGIIFLALALAYNINPARGPVLDVVQRQPLYLPLIMPNIVVSHVGQYLLFALPGTSETSFIFFPFMFIVQVLVYGFLGKVISALLPSMPKSI